ncbi:EF-P lysine aminoacylase GenX [Patescibacteria group bacterium]|nr:EF-P lysine aminoacylase GenX [Patescibacteria group bacterium]MBU1721245.1 EF-P lysine aminoacylase GenX [Patescibacteria group bacterium]MBU1901047.1 EF-P lysine aminoacylase GenX [Patescibacteria group bacterium]
MVHFDHMEQIMHIAKQKKVLDIRWALLRATREFFWKQNFFEVETPQLLAFPGQDPYLTPMGVSVANEHGEQKKYYLHTSPEYSMKKMLAAGYSRIFSLGKCFRNNESFGGLHNPEFTMLEWYETESNMFTIMQRVEDFFDYVYEQLGEKYQLKKINIRRMHMNDLWQDVLGVSLEQYLDQTSLFHLCKERGYFVSADEQYENLFYHIFLHEIEPALEKMGAVIVHHYPAQMASLSQLSQTDTRYAERFELYIDGIELANAFTELTDEREQKKRLEKEQSYRKDQGQEVFGIDYEFLAAVKGMPPSAGIALGFDRLVQVLLNCKNINDVLVLPMKYM